MRTHHSRKGGESSLYVRVAYDHEVAQPGNCVAHRTGTKIPRLEQPKLRLATPDFTRAEATVSSYRTKNEGRERAESARRSLKRSPAVFLPLPFDA